MNNFTSWFNYSQGNLIYKVDYDVNNNPIYLGWAAPGSSDGANVWRLAKNTFDVSNNFVSKTFPSGSPSFTFSWTNRASYTYS